MSIKILHLVKDCANNEGIANFPIFVPLYLSIVDGKKYSNLVISTRYGYRPKHLPKFRENHLKIKHLPNYISLFREILSFKPDIIIVYHHFGSPLALFLLLLSKMLKCKTIVQPDINEYAIPKFHKSVLKTIRDAFRWLLRVLQLTLFDKIVCATKYEIEVISRIKKKSRKKCCIIPWGTEFEVSTSKKENYIVTASKWWRDRKNLHTIIKVFSQVIKVRPNLKLVVVGKFLEGKDTEYEIMYGKKMTGEEYKQKIVSLINELNLQDQISFIGVKHGEELQELFRKAKIYYMPTKFETFGMVFVEAMASGTPIVAMKNSAVQYVVKDGVTGFLRNDEEGQKEAILRLLTDKKLYRKMQENCLKEAVKYKWENIIKKWIKIFNSLVDRK